MCAVQARSESYRYATGPDTRSQVSKLEEPFVEKSAHKSQRDRQRALDALQQELFMVLCLSFSPLSTPSTACFPSLLSS